MKKIVLFTIVIILSSSAFSQIAELRIKKNFPLEISWVADMQTLSAFIDSIPDADSNLICFKIVPQERGKSWGKKYNEMLQYLKIFQGSNIEFDMILRAKPEFENSVMAFFIDKLKIDISQPFYFKYESTLSGAMKLPETLMNNYSSFMEIFNTGENLINNRKYHEAYSVLSALFPTSDKYDNFVVMSRYRDGIQLIYNATERHYQYLNNSYSNLTKEIDQLNTIDISYLNMLRDINSEVAFARETFSTFLKSDGEYGVGSDEIDSNYQSLFNDISLKLTSLEEDFKKQTLEQFTNQDYSMNQFRFLMEGVTNILLTSEGITLLNKYSIDSLTINKSHPNSVFQQVLTVNPSRKLELELLLNILTENLQESFKRKKNEFVIFNEGILQHLEYLRYNDRSPNRETLEPKPYFNITKGFDLIIANEKNVYAFYEHLLKAIQLIGEIELLEEVFLWKTSCEIEISGIAQSGQLLSAIKYFNEGYKYLMDGNLQKALVNFQTAKSIYPQLADSHYYEGLTYLLNGQTIIAAYIFKQTVEQFPEYLPAIVRYAESINSGPDADNLLFTLNEILDKDEYKTQPPYSLSTFYYPNYLKAQMLYVKEDYSNCLATLDTECKRINPNNPDIYYLEGLVNIKRGQTELVTGNFFEAIEKAIENFYNNKETDRKIRIHGKNAD
jgi:tetratricopeptide (TPR) repeat protein